MALASDYRTGTITVAANATAVTGAGTAWLTAGFQEGDMLIANGYFGIVGTVNSNTSITLAQPWRGGALSAAAYRLRYQGDGSRVSAQARQLIEILGGSGNLEAFGKLVGAANKLPYFTGAGTLALADFVGLGALAGLTAAANKLPYFTGANTAGLADLSDFARTFLDDANGPAVYGTLGEVPDGQMPGRLRAQPLSTTDWNTALDAGFYNGINAANSPQGSTTVGIVSSRLGVHTAQIVWNVATGDCFTRARANEVWGPWQKSVTLNNLIGTVSEAGGIPTGAVVEYGSNSNGRYVRFAGGLQICRINGLPTDCSTAQGNMYRSSAFVNWTFPAAFAATSDLNVVGTSQNIARWVVAGAASTTSVQVGQYQANSSATSIDMSLMATGRWT